MPRAKTMPKEEEEEEPEISTQLLQAVERTADGTEIEEAVFQMRGLKLGENRIVFRIPMPFDEFRERMERLKEVPGVKVRTGVLGKSITVKVPGGKIVAWANVSGGTTAFVKRVR